MRIGASGDLQNVKTLEDLKRYVTIFLGQVSDAINGKISVVDNIRGQIIAVTFPVANVTVQVAHTLGATPVGYLAISADSALSLYDGDSPNSKQFAYLKSSATGVARVLVLA